MTRNNRIREIKTVFGKITVQRIIPGNQFIAGSASVALLAQEVVRVYPGSQAGNSKQDGLYEDSHFNNPNTTREFSQVRYCLVKVPNGESVEAVQAKIDALENPTIYRILSNSVSDVITDEQKTMMNQGRLTYFVRDDEGKIVTDPSTNKPLIKLATAQEMEDRLEVKGYKRDENNELIKGNDGENVLTTFVDPWNKRQFRAFYFSATQEVDVDLREGTLANMPAAVATEQIADLSSQETPELAEKIAS